MKTLLLMMLVALLTPCANAAWSSGGGELIQDGANPWYLENTSEVRYCVAVDEDHFGMPRDKIESLIKRGFAKWESEFAKAEYPAYIDRGPGARPLHEIKVATQRFLEVSCDAAVDMRFQFGQLDEGQIRRLGDPRRVVAVALRDQYDFKEMRARGFVYVAPESGPLRPSAPSVIEHPWTSDNGNRLYAVLLHELGHVFGLQHGGDRFHLMGAGFPEMMVSSEVTPDFINSAVNTSFIKYTGGHGASCVIKGNGLPVSMGHFWGLSPGAKGVRLDVNGDDVDVMQTTSLDAMCGLDRSKWSAVGAIKLSTASPPLLDSVVTVFLPPEQEVFDIDSNGSYLNSAMRVTRVRQGIYTSADGSTKRDVFAILPPNLWDVRFGGVDNGRLVVNALDWQ